MNPRTRRRGFTLPELLITSALFITLAAMASYGVLLGLRAQEFDRSVRESQLVARDVLNRLVDEMRTATALPVVGLGTNQVPSGVLHPDSYGAGSPFTGTLYASGTTASGSYFVKNRVIFSRPGTESAGTSFNPSNLSDYVYVEWLIPPSPSDGSLPWNRIYRKVHNVGPTSPGHAFSTNRWLVQKDYFVNGTGLRATFSTEESWMVARLPGANDMLGLTVEHPPYVDPVSGTVGGAEAGFGTSYVRNLF